MEFMHKVIGVVIIDAEKQRVFAKYYSPDLQDSLRQRVLENDLMGKIEAAAGGSAKSTEGGSTTSSSNNMENIILYEGYTVIYKTDADITLMVLGPLDENEVVLYSVLTCVYESLQTLLKCNGALDKRMLLESYDAVVLVVDEVLDDGVIMETNSANVCPDVAPYFTERSDNLLTAVNTINKYLKQNL
eukprot:PhF_6_TR3898/c0_g1_i1/m.5492/K20472/COPZ, RET3; coatomer subunit zeta